MDDKNHLWSGESIPHRIDQDGKTILLRQCSLCGRDFAQGIGGCGWRAVYIGVFKVEVLADAVRKRWLKEECPRQRLPTDEKARATRPVSN
jgi:hypothetical protein